MSHVSELYQQVILDHNKKPRNYRSIENARTAHGYNPLCGDQLKVYVKLDDAGTIADVAFEGTGCAISKAAASLMTVTVKGKTADEVAVMFDEYHRLVRGELAADAATHLGRLTVFAGVSEFPARVKCASLAWHALKGALEGEGTVSTE
jgi:nitrogen fixation NifU-like protein